MAALGAGALVVGLSITGVGGGQAAVPTAPGVQPRNGVAIPISQWAALSSATVLEGAMPAVLGPRDGVDFGDDSVVIPTGFGVNVPAVTVLSPNLLGAPTLIPTGISQVYYTYGSAAQGDDTVWVAIENPTDLGSVYAVSVRTRVVSGPYSTPGTYNGGNRAYYGVAVKDNVGSDDTVYVGYQVNVNANTGGGVLQFAASSPSSMSSLFQVASDFRAWQLALRDDTLFAPNDLTAGSVTASRVARATPPSLDRALSMPWASRGSAVGDDTIFAAAINGTQVLAANLAAPDDSRIISFPGTSKLQYMSAWKHSGDDTVFVADYRAGANGVVWMLNARTGSLDDSVTLAGAPVYVTAARPDLVYASGSNKVTAIGIVSGTTPDTAGVEDDSVTITMSLPQGFNVVNGDDTVVENVYLDDSVVKFWEVLGANQLKAQVPAGTGTHAVVVELNGGNRIRVGTFAYQATVTFDPNGGSGTMAPQVASSSTALTTNAFSWPGYSFAGWNTSADGTGMAYANQAPYPFTASTTLYAQWTAAPRPPRPVPTVSPAPTPTPSPTPTPTTSPQPVPTPLPPGDSALTVDGKPTPVQVDPKSDDRGLEVTGDGWTMTLDGLGRDGQALNLGPDGVLILEQERDVKTTGTGFLPNSEVDLYLDPPTLLQSSTTGLWWHDAAIRVAEAIYVGTVQVNAAGSFTGTATLSPEIEPGDHVLQSVGISPSGQTRALSLGVIVKPWLTLEQGVRKPAGMHDRITTAGDSRGIPAGVKLTPYIKYRGQSAFQKGRATITVQSDGSFTWTRLIRKDKGLTAYVAYTDIESNRVYWVKVR